MGISIEASDAVTSADDLAAIASAEIGADHIKIPPLSRAYQITVYAYANGNGGGDHSTADMDLYVNGQRVAHRHDASFHTYSFNIEHSFVSERGVATHVRSEHTNSGATETSYGLEVRRIIPF